MHPINAPASLQLTDICLAGTIIAQPPPEKETLPGTFDALVADGSIGATFGAGAVPVQLNFLHDEKTMPQMSSIKTRLEVSWKQPTRNMWLQFGSREDAEAAVRSLDGKNMLWREAESLAEGLTLPQVLVRSSFPRRRKHRYVPQTVTPLVVSILLTHAQGNAKPSHYYQRISSGKAISYPTTYCMLVLSQTASKPFERNFPGSPNENFSELKCLLTQTL